MAETALQNLDWHTSMDYEINLILGGYNSNAEYFNDGYNKEDIEEAFVKIYKGSVEFWSNNKNLNFEIQGADTYFISTYGLEEDVCIEGSEHLYQAACIWATYSEEYEDERKEINAISNDALREEKMELLIDEITAYLSESEYSSWGYYRLPSFLHYYCTKGLSYMHSEGINDIYLSVNDCQNSLTGETRSCFNKDGEDIAHYEYDIIEFANSCNFIRIPKTRQMIGGK